MGTKIVSLVRSQMLGLIALLVALGGTSYAVAVGTVDSADIKNNSIRSKDVRNGALKAKDFKPGQLPVGATGAPGTARAYATMRPDECFGPGDSCSIYNVKAVQRIVRVGTGTYCVVPAAGLSFEGVTPSLTTDDYNSGPANGSGTPILAYSSLNSSCADDQVEVRTYRATGAGPAVNASNSTSFGIVIP
jgi:hypothetical protein